MLIMTLEVLHLQSQILFEQDVAARSDCVTVNV